MQKNETYQEDLKILLKYGYKIFLNKDSEDGINRHVFYTTQNTHGYHFYHVRYVMDKSGKVEHIKDFPVVTIAFGLYEKYTTEVETTVDKIMNFIKVNGYEVSCNRKE